MRKANPTKTRRRIYWIVGLGVGIPGVLILAFFLAALLTASRPEAIVAVQPKEIPEAWIGSDPEGDRGVGLDAGEEPATDGGPASAVTKSAEAAEPPETAFSSSGALSFVGDGRRFGSEAYQLDIDENGAILESSGVFEFKVVVTVRATFHQSLTADGELRPRAYALDFSAPLGIRREVRGEIGDDSVLFTNGDGRREVPVDPGRAFVLGTFSTYALIPALFSARQTDGSAVFDVLVFGGPPHQEDESLAEEPDGLPTMRVVRLEVGVIRSGDIELTVDRYGLESAFGDSLLFAKDGEFLGMIAGEGEDRLFVYRSDYFRGGFEITTDPR